MDDAIGGKIADYLIKPINPSQILLSVKKLLQNRQLIDENTSLKKEMEKFEKERLKSIKADLYGKIETIENTQVIKSIVDINDASSIRDLAFQIRGEKDNIILILGAQINEKPNLSIMISDDLIEKNGWNAGKVIREAAQKIQGGGGGQAFFATAGGKKPEGLQEAINLAVDLIFKGS